VAKITLDTTASLSFQCTAIANRIKAAATFAGEIVIAFSNRLPTSEHEYRVLQHWIASASNRPVTLIGRARDASHVFQLYQLDLAVQMQSEFITCVDPSAPAPAGAVSPHAPWKVDMGELITLLLRSDQPNKMYPTVVVDEQGVALGLVYSNDFSVRVALAKRRGVYWSRSRNSLWEKGLTSQAVQYLIRLELDCDRDALRFTVRQVGTGFCHLNRRTCWDGDAGMGALFRVLEERVQHADKEPNSYTVKLLRNSTMLHAKILEEAKELVDASDPAHITAEAADVVYFAAVKLASKGIPWHAAEAELDRRSLRVTRRKGDAKPAFLQALAAASSGPAAPLSTAATNTSSVSGDNVVTVLDYGAGNVRSLRYDLRACAR